jgi:hypothetical protein
LTILLHDGILKATIAYRQPTLNENSMSGVSNSDPRDGEKFGMDALLRTHSGVAIRRKADKPGL